MDGKWVYYQITSCKCNEGDSAALLFDAKRAAVMVQGGRGRGADITPEHPAESIGRVGADGGGPLSTRTHGWWE